MNDGVNFRLSLREGPRGKELFPEEKIHPLGSRHGENAMGKSGNAEGDNEGDNMRRGTWNGYQGAFTGWAIALMAVAFAGWVSSASAGGSSDAAGAGQTPMEVGHRGANHFYPVDVINRPYPFTPKFVWRSMFSGIDERIAAERHAIGVGGEAAQELAFHRQNALHPPIYLRDVGRVLDTGRHYVGCGWTRLDTVHGIVWVYNPHLDPWVSALAPANRAITQEIEDDLDFQLGREAPGYYNERGQRVSKGDPSAVRLVGRASAYRR